MSYLIIRTVGFILLTVIVTFMWIGHKKKHTLFIKVILTSENQKKRYKKWENGLSICRSNGMSWGMYNGWRSAYKEF